MTGFTPEAAEAVRSASVEGFYKLSRGGLEVGGVLFGCREGDCLQVSLVRPIACSHSRGPSFLLSESDHGVLSSMLADSAADPALAGLVPIGWFHSHSRGGSDFSAEDLALHERHFREPWQIALVVFPERAKPARGTVYVRSAGGALAPEQEIVLDPKVLTRVDLTGAAKSLPLEPPQPVVDSQAPPPAKAAPELPAPVVETVFVKQRPGAFYWVLFVLAWCIAGACAAYALRGLWLPQAPAPIHLRLLDEEGQLAVLWEPASPEIREAEGGALKFLDDGEEFSMELTRDQIRSGVAVYSRRSRTVVVHLLARLPGGRHVEGQVTFVGKGLTPAPAAPEVQPPPHTGTSNGHPAKPAQR
jgi:proteasome lid subunit RPN8/RPN11